MAEKKPSIICRGKNIHLSTVKQFLFAIPMVDMPKAEFYKYAEDRMPGFSTTHSQIARQMALYYCDVNDICHPKFRRVLSNAEIIKYVQNWAENYFIPNPYTPSFPQECEPTNIYAFFYQHRNDNLDFTSTLNLIFNTELNEIDKAKSYLLQFTDIVELSNNKYTFTSDKGVYVPLNVNLDRNDVVGYFNYFGNLDEIQNSSSKKVLNSELKPLQQIYYGAPGTGKSYEIKKLTEGKHVIRTTFHPDSDYSTFVGAYKPVMEEVDARVVPVVFNNSGIGFDKNNGTFKENRIVYKFVKQAFLKAYLGAWKKFANSQYNNTTTPPSSFNIPGAGYYTISGVEPKNIILSRIFDFSKKAVLDEWPNLWKNGTFEVPSGPQSGKSVQHAIAIWINNQINSCTVDNFEEGWKKLISHIKESGTVDVVKKTQTYILSLSEGKEDLLSVKVEAAKKSWNNLLEIYEGKKTSYRLDNNLVSILKEYDDKSFKDAWDKLAKDVNSGKQVDKIDVPDDELEPQFLIIEEINRGNCAQIFGDLFQLLDRSENGYSTYPIEADSDIQDVIKKAFEDNDEYKLDFLDINGAIDDYTSNYGSNLSEDVKQGRVLLLPPNLYIWATMNTSDQSLFPIDSAFKRRWEWKYIPIGYKNVKWTIEIGKKSYPWVDFQRKINDRIFDVDNSEDKQLGDYFVNANQTDNKISSDTLLNKILFYLWNDVCKDDPDQIFRWKDDKDNNQEKSIKFSDFFCDKDERDRKLQGFMAALDINAIETNNSEENNTPAENVAPAENDNDVNS